MIAKQLRRAPLLVATLLAALATQHLAAAAVVNAAAWNDDTNVYYQLTVDANFGSLSYINLLVNADVDGSTGFADSKYRNGADKLVQCQFPSTGACGVYNYAGGAPGTGAWGWSWITSTTMTVNAATGLVTVTVPRSALGETSACTESATLVYWAQFTSASGLADLFSPVLTHIYSPASTCTGANPTVRAALPARAPRSSVTFRMVYSSGLSGTKTVYIDSQTGGVTTGPGATINADYRLVGNSLQTWTGSAWSTGTTTGTFSDDSTRLTATWTIPRSAIGDSNLCSSSYRAIYASDNTNTAVVSVTSTTYVAGSSQPTVPAYIYPYASTTTYNAATNTISPSDTQTPYYQTLYSKMSTTTTMAVLNPVNGPVIPNNSTNTDLFARYIKVMTDMKSNYPSKSKLLYYVKTGNGARASTAVKADVDSYYNYYNNFTNANIRIDGIFLDEANVVDCATSLSYYTDIISYIRTKAAASFSSRSISGAAPAFVVLNPGTIMPECYIAKSGADAIVTYEASQWSYNNGGYSPAGWEDRYPTNRVWHLVHTTSATTTDFTINTSKDRGAGLVYVTSDVYINTATDNPWDTMPSQSLWDAHNAAAIGTGCPAV